ncbi:Polyisoprenoid-binding protein YceI [Sphingomonas guangdongensis]|uniref:Polyisoprenoid-binding protein YceI n=1 Tax=Sphingomonas guangdongensis TaxID=1141890 RepID=A0A285QZ55_9SPHN|nr:YceI family protein [Sphingomonas guangdongensis]SOB87193.1 Polyisoprenoid-binding protein YceI [Sphingomonas guangdongensis]
MRLAYAALLALAATTVTATAQQAPGSKNPAAITGGTYTADPGHSLVTWTVDHLGFSPYTGIFGDVTGTLVLDPKNPNAAKVDVTIPVSKVTTASAGLTAHLLRAGKDGGKPDFFGASAADAKFVSTSVRATGQTAKVTGNLTLNGVTRPVTLDARFYGAGKGPAQMGSKETVGFHATGTIQRTQWGLGFGVPMVGDEVKLDIAAAFEK